MFENCFPVWSWHIQNFLFEFLAALVVTMVFTTYIIWKFAQLMQMSHGDLATSPVSSVGLSWHMGLVDNIMYLTVLSSKWGHLALSLSIVFLCLVSYIATRLRATSGELCKLWQGKEIFLFSKT